MTERETQRERGGEGERERQRQTDRQTETERFTNGEENMKKGEVEKRLDCVESAPTT